MCNYNTFANSKVLQTAACQQSSTAASLCPRHKLVHRRCASHPLAQPCVTYTVSAARPPSNTSCCATSSSCSRGTGSGPVMHSHSSCSHSLLSGQPAWQAQLQNSAFAPHPCVQDRASDHEPDKRHCTQRQNTAAAAPAEVGSQEASTVAEAPAVAGSATLPGRQVRGCQPSPSATTCAVRTNLNQAITIDYGRLRPAMKEQPE